MLLLIGLPVWVVFLNLVMKPNTGSRKNAKNYMALCAIAVILIMGLRSRYAGSPDTSRYCELFNSARAGVGLIPLLKQSGVFDGNLLLSEAGFYTFTWLSSRILPEAQWFLMLTSIIIVTFTARFIWNHSENYCVSWLVFLCLGSMTFAMNGMRQALSMSICLFAYDYAKQKRLLPFACVVLAAVLFHKSAMFFSIVYVMRNMKMNYKSIALLAAGVLVFMLSADRFAFLYDDMTGQDYSDFGSTEGGGYVTVMIYLIAIVLTFVCSRRLRDKDVFVPLALAVLGMVIYLGRYFSAQIYERMSYYFFYFLMILFPAVFRDLKPRDRLLVRMCFATLAILLFAYRLNNSSHANFRLFW